MINVEIHFSRLSIRIARSFNYCWVYVIFITVYVISFVACIVLFFLSLYYLAADQNVGVLHKLFVGEGEVEMSSDLFLFHIFILSPFKCASADTEYKLHLQGLDQLWSLRTLN